MQRAFNRRRSLALLVLLAGGIASTIYLTLRRERLDRLLLEAVLRRDTAAVKTLLEQGADANTRDMADHGPIRLADMWNAFWIHGRNAPERQNPTVLMLATGDPAILKLLLDHGADVNAAFDSPFLGSGRTALMIAARSDSNHAVRLLLDHGADPNRRIQGGRMDGHTALMDAAEFGRSESVELLLDRGADVIARQGDWTALMAAAENARAANIRLLLGRGADARARTNSGITALTRAADSGCSDCIAPLLDADATDGDTALLHAAGAGSAQTVRVLLDYGAAIEARDPEGKTALLLAVESGHSACVRLLLDRGADIHAMDERGWTALREAWSDNRVACARLLRQRGAVR